MASRFLVCLLLTLTVVTVCVDCNSEGDALHAWKAKLVDPHNVLQTWDPTLVNPCTWWHVTCNVENSVTRVDLGNSGLSGPLVPQLGQLANLQYLEVYGNSINGSIPSAIGNLKKLVSLDLYDNRLTGNIPSSLGNLKQLRFMRVNSNKLKGTIPKGVIGLISSGNLRILNVSDNLFAGTVHTDNPKGFAITTIIQDPKAPPK